MTFYGNRKRHELIALGAKTRKSTQNGGWNAHKGAFGLSNRIPYGNQGRTRRGVIAVDFDGVLSKYDGLKGINKLGEPLKDAVESINSLYDEGYVIKIYTARQITPQLIEWLKKHGFKWHEIMKKEGFDVLIDDRVIQFNGSWKRVMNSIKKFQPYWKKKL